MKLSKRFLIVPVVLVMLCYLFYSSYRDVKERTLIDFNREQFTLAIQASRGIENFFIYYQRELQFLSKIKYVPELNEQAKDLLADFYKNNSDQIEAVTIVDSNGILRYTYPLINGVIGKDISVEPHVKAVIQTHKPTVSDVFTSVQGFRTIAFQVPILINNEYRGSIGILIPLEKLGRRFVEKINTGETGYGWMISEQGIQLFNPKNNFNGKSAREIFRNFPSIINLIDLTLKKSEGTEICYTDSVDARDNEYSKTLAAFHRVSFENTFWTILIFTPEKEVYAKLTSFRNRLFILFALIIIVMTVVFYLSFKASNILKEEKKRKAVEKTLIESEQRFSTEKKHSQERMLTLSRALESIGECVYITDIKSKLIFVNKAFCKTYGYNEEEIIGRDIKILSPVEINDYPIEKTIQDGWTGELINIRKDGTKFPVELTTSFIRDENGNPIALIGIAVNITERKKVEIELIKAKEKAEESDRLKSVFLTNMSHELRTPLNAIIGFSGIMVDSGPDHNTISYSQTIHKSGQHLLRLVEDIFDTTMIETGQIKVNYERTDIIEVLEEVRDIIHGERLNENKTGVELILNLYGSGNQKYLVTDSRKLKQILMNLLRNALKFTHKGSIEFGFTEIVDSGKSFIQFYVKDTGIGIDNKHHDTIFNMFRQIDDTHTRKFGGMGIGLSIAKKTVELLGGKIWVVSEPAVGSEFFFTIPYLHGTIEKNNTSDEKELIMEKKFAGKTVLIAEDEQSNFDFLKILLTRMDIRVLWAKDGLEAVDICKSDPTINLVFMDIKMPFMNGYEATRKIKNIRPDLPIIAQTAYAMISDKMEADKAGCDGYLSKPIKIRQIIEMLEVHLKV